MAITQVGPATVWMRVANGEWVGLGRTEGPISLTLPSSLSKGEGAGGSMKIIDETGLKTVPLSRLAAGECFVLPASRGSSRGPYRVSTEQNLSDRIFVLSLADFVFCYFDPRLEVQPVQLTLTVQSIERTQPSTPGGEAA